jgi:hypothetical protein
LKTKSIGTVFSLCLCLLIVSCTKEPPKCDDKQIVDLVLKIYTDMYRDHSVIELCGNHGTAPITYDQLNTNKEKEGYKNIWDELDVMKKGLKLSNITNIHPTGINKEISKSTCNGNLTVKDVTPTGDPWSERNVSLNYSAQNVNDKIQVEVQYQ